MSGSTSSADGSWRALFVPGSERRLFVVVRKHGYPLLALSGNVRSICDGLCLYPAQSFFAKCARNALRFGLRWGLPIPLGCEELTFDPSDSFWQFLTRQVGEMPEVAILCGNPNAPGQRFTILASNAGKRIIVKAGVSKQAQELIVQEERFLRALNGSIHAPSVLDSFRSENLAAFATEFVPGSSPSPKCAREAAAVLESWIQPGEVALGEIEAWKRLTLAARLPSFDFEALKARLVAVTPVHGDFAPWNIKATPRGWAILDWERGELSGVPGWDWFHFVIQPRVLVSRMSPDLIVQNLEEMIGSSFFQNYARKAGIAGIERQLALAYLEYMICVIPPSEGVERLKAVQQFALTRWL